MEKSILNSKEKNKRKEGNKDLILEKWKKLVKECKLKYWEEDFNAKKFFNENKEIDNKK